MKLTHILLALFLPTIATAQQTSGEIIFQETVKFEIDLPEEQAELLKNMPTSQSFTRGLLFNEKASIYKDWGGSDEEDIEMTGGNDNTQIQIEMKVPENTLYTNLEDGTSINSREFFGRMFLISGEIEKLPWKLTGKQKKVLGYACQQAVFEDEDRNVEAWFTPQIPLSGGPGEFGGLPGMVLEVSLDEGQRTMTAVKVDLKPVAENDIEKPKKGKAMSRKDFDKMEEEKMKEMEAEMGGGGARMIIRN